MTRKGLATILAAALLTGATVAARADDAPPPDAAAPAKGAAQTGLKAGDVLGKDNWQQAEGQLPPEILRHYKDGEYVNQIVAWPDGIYKWDPNFKAASDANAGKYTISAEGSVVDKATGIQPPLIYGLPFDKIDKNDPHAGSKVLWNFQYQYWNEGNSHNVTLLAWVNPKSQNRASVQDVYFLFYDGQGPEYQLENPNNYSGQFIAVATSPADLNGTAALTWRYRDPTKRDSNWAYVPALRRIRAVSPANRSDGFLGSDMSQDDGPFFDGKPEDFTWTLTGETDMYRLVDPLSFAGKATQVWMPTGGWHSVWPERPVVGYQDPTWKGIGWAPIVAGLAKRSMWIIEGVPKDRYYLFGRIQLYIDKETYQGAWNRKYGWNGEHLNTLQVVAYQKESLKRPTDGKMEYLWASNFSYQCAESIKMNRATLGGLLPPGKDVPNDRRMHYDPSFFDYSSLNRFGK